MSSPRGQLGSSSFPEDKCLRSTICSPIALCPLCKHSTFSMNTSGFPPNDREAERCLGADSRPASQTPWLDIILSFEDWKSRLRHWHVGLLVRALPDLQINLVLF